MFYKQLCWGRIQNFCQKIEGREKSIQIVNF